MRSLTLLVLLVRLVGSSILVVSKLVKLTARGSLLKEASVLHFESVHRYRSDGNFSKSAGMIRKLDVRTRD